MALTKVTQGLYEAPTGSYTFRNRIINGDMRIDQRNVGTSLTPTNGQFSVDRWFANVGSGGASKYSIQQSTVAPPGFTNSLLITTLSAYSVGADDVYAFNQLIEGNNVADLGWGTANAVPVTLSFWIKGSITGTYGIVFKNGTNARAFPVTYTINAADTWEYKTITIPGDTSGTWYTNTSLGLRVLFGFGSGSTYNGAATGSWTTANYYGVTGTTSVVGTAGATLYITGVQLEVGSVATTFERRPYGLELSLCQRYFYKTFEQGTKPANSASVGMTGVVSAYSTGSTYLGTLFKFPVTMRVPPSTVTLYGFNGATDIFDVYIAGLWSPFTTIGITTASSEGVAFYALKSGSFTQYYSYLFSGNLTASAEF